MKIKAALKEIDQKADHTKEYNLTMKGKKITLEEESNVSAKIWTKPQQEYLDKKFEAIDKRFEAIDKRFEAIESDVATLKEDMTEVKSDLKLIINHLGIKKAA